MNTDELFDVKCKVHKLSKDNMIKFYTECVKKNNINHTTNNNGVFISLKMLDQKQIYHIVSFLKILEL